jgi:hypothetical protein
MQEWKVWAVCIAALLALVAGRILLIRPESSGVKEPGPERPDPKITPATNGKPVPRPIVRSDPEPGMDHVVALVGGVSISRRRLADWTKISELRSGEPGTEAEAFSDLVAQAVQQEVARRAFAIEPTAADLERKAAELGRDEEDRAILGKIETLLGDRRRFLDEFVRPAEVETALWKRFRSDSTVHQAALGTGQKILDRALSEPTPFSGLSAPGAAFGRYSVPLEAATKDPARLPKLENLPVDLAPLNPGQVCPTLVETPDLVRVVRLSRIEGKYAEVEVWTVRKQGLHEWVAQQARSIECKLADPAMRAHLDALPAGHWVRALFGP